MTIKIYPIKVEATDSEENMLFTVETFDECVATVTLKSTLHNVMSWREMSAAIEQALDLLRLETGD